MTAAWTGPGVDLLLAEGFQRQVVESGDLSPVAGGLDGDDVERPGLLAGEDRRLPSSLTALESRMIAPVSRSRLAPSAVVIRFSVSPGFVSMDSWTSETCGSRRASTISGEILRLRRRLGDRPDDQPLVVGQRLAVPQVADRASGSITISWQARSHEGMDPVSFSGIQPTTVTPTVALEERRSASA